MFGNIEPFADDIVIGLSEMRFHYVDESFLDYHLMDSSIRIFPKRLSLDEFHSHLFEQIRVCPVHVCDVHLIVFFRVAFDPHIIARSPLGEVLFC